MEIWFGRHGQTEWNVQKRFQGHQDSALTALGRCQAQTQGRILRSAIVDFSAIDILISPLGRVVETVSIALPDQKYHIVDDLCELELGSLTGMGWAARTAYDPRFASTDPDDIAAAYFSIHDGETQELFERRLQRVIANLRRPTVIFSHGFVGQVLRKQIMGVDRFCDLQPSHDQGVIFHLNNGVETVLAE